MTRYHDVQVVADPDRACLAVRWGGRTLSQHRTQANALSAARRAAKRHQVDLVTHGRDGRIRSKDSYGTREPQRILNSNGNRKPWGPGRGVWSQHRIAAV